MDHQGGRIAAGLACLVVVWVIVYWLWTPTEPRISFGDSSLVPPPRQADAPGVRPAMPSAVVDAPPRPSVDPALQAQGTAATAPPAAASTRPTQGVIPPQFEEYTVREGDTFASIAQRFLGSRARADLIARANPLVDPTRIRAGRVIRIPKDPSNIQGRPIESQTPQAATDAAVRRHTVARGDTLTSISRRYYGSIRHTDRILRANRSVLSRPEDLRPGQVLVIPTIE